MRALRIILCVLIERFTFASRTSCCGHLIFTRMAAHSVAVQGIRISYDRNHWVSHGLDLVVYNFECLFDDFGLTYHIGNSRWLEYDIATDCIGRK